MHAALGRVDVVGEREDIFLIAVVILERQFRERVALHAAHVDDAIVQGFFFLVEPGDELADTALVAHRVAALALALFLARRALIFDRDAKAGVQESLLAHARVERLVGVFKVFEHLGVGLERNGRARVVGRADDGHLLRDLAAGEFHLVDVAVLVHLHRQPLGKGVDDARAHAVQTAGDLIASAAELTARVQHGIDDLERGAPRLRLNVDRNAAAVIHNGDGVALVDRHFNFRAVARKCLVNGVIHNFVNEVVQAARGRGADVHARALAHRLKPLENLNFRGVVVIVFIHRRGLQDLIFCHLGSPFVIRQEEPGRSRFRPVSPCLKQCLFMEHARCPLPLLLIFHSSLQRRARKLG